MLRSRDTRFRKRPFGLDDVLPAASKDAAGCRGDSLSLQLPDVAYEPVGGRYPALDDGDNGADHRRVRADGEGRRSIGRDVHDRPQLHEFRLVAHLSEGPPSDAWARNLLQHRLYGVQIAVQPDEGLRTDGVVGDGHFSVDPNRISCIR